LIHFYKRDQSIMQLGWLMVTGLTVLAALTDARALKRKKRDADALAAGTDWFTSFYTLFDDKDAKSPKAAEKTTLISEPQLTTYPVPEEPAASKPRPASLPVDSFFPEINNAGGGEASGPSQTYQATSPDLESAAETRKGQSFSGSTNSYGGPGEPDISSNNDRALPQPAFFKDKAPAVNPEFNYGNDPTPPFSGNAPVFEPNYGYDTYDYPNLPTNEGDGFVDPFTSFDSVYDQTFNDGPVGSFDQTSPYEFEDPLDFQSTFNTETSGQDSNLPTEEANEFEALPQLSEDPPFDYYDQPSPYTAEEPTASAFTDSGEWFQDFDTSHIYNTYGFQPDYNYGGSLPDEWYYNNAGYPPNPFGMQPNYGLLDTYGLQGVDPFGMMGLGEEDGGPDMEMDGTPSSDYESAQNLDASQFLDDFDMFRQAGPLLVNDNDDEQIDPEEEPTEEEEPVANDIEAGGPSNYYPSPNNFENFMDQFDQPGVNFHQPGMEETGWTSVYPDAGNYDFADFMMSSRDPDNQFSPEQFNMMFGDPSISYADPSAIPNKPLSSSAIPNKEPADAVDVPLNPDALGFSLESPDFRLPKEECITAAGQIGECLSAYDCGLEDGELDGLCHQGHDSYHHLRSCCVYTSYCGFQTNKEVTYLKNPDYPSSTRTSGDCVFKIDLLPGVCQIRLDFLELELKPLVNGECEEGNALHIGSSDPGAFIPVKKLCGTVSSDVEDALRTDIPHVYVHVDRDHEAMAHLNDVRPPNKDDISVKLTLKVDNYPSRWNIRASQISCDGANLQAPTGCGQYYNSNSGNISSFNFKDGQYMKDLSFSACIKRDPLACAVEYNFKHLGIGETKGGQGKLGYGLTCKDYLLVNGERTALCGSQNLPRRMVFPTHGPESIFFSSDSQFRNKVDVGYSLEYTHLRNCTGVEYFKYPVKR